MLNFRTHTEYSYKKAILKIDSLVEYAKKAGDTSFCITDIGSMTSFVKAFSASEKYGLKFIPGCELRIESDIDVNKNQIDDRYLFLKKEFNLKRTTDQMRIEYQEEMDQLRSIDSSYNHSLIAIAKNQVGLKSLFDSFNNEIYNASAEVFLNSNENFIKNSDGLIALTGGNDSQVLFYIQKGKIEKAEFIMKYYKEKLGDDFYCQIEYCPRLKDEYTKMVEIARKHSIPIVASNTINYTLAEDEKNYRLYRNTMNLPEKFVAHDEHFMQGNELKNHLLEMFEADVVEEALDNINKIDEKCEGVIPPKANPMVDCSESLLSICEKGWEKLRKGTKREEESRIRFNYELEVINGKNFSEYFMKVFHIVDLAYLLNILMGPARGSGGGSEVCFLTGITKVDPLEHDLYFERFINPGRYKFPDIDLDMASVPLSAGLSFSSDTEELETVEDEDKPAASRNLLVQELIKRDIFSFSGYINNEVRGSTLILFKSLARYHEIPFYEANKISTDSEFSEKLKEKKYTGWLKDAVIKYELEWEDVWDVVEKRIEFCYELSGIPQNSMIAASGVIMADVKATLPVHDGAIGFDGKDLESWNYIKYDLLTVTTLDQIQYFYGLDFDWNDYYDPKVWEVVQKGDTDFVFQFSSPGMKHILTGVKPGDIQTLAEINALYRPGPIGIGLVEKYIALKTGIFNEKTELNEEEIIIMKILKDAFGDKHCGLCVFQEDVMKICQVGSGFTLTEADNIREAMGKKKLEAMAEYKPQFIDNWKFAGDADKIWVALEEFAKYAFNKAHAVGYSIIAYQTAKMWCYDQERFLEYIINFDPKRRQSAIEKCKKLDYKFTYPTLETLSSDCYKVEDGYVIMPGNGEGTYNSYVDFLFGDTPDLYNLIYKGVCDKLTKDRLALAELVSTCLSKPKASALFMEPQNVKFTRLEEILEGLKLCGAIVSHEKMKNGEIEVYVTRGRGAPNKVTFHSNSSHYCKLNICKFDRKYFGKIRDGIISDLPFINTVAIERTLENIKTNLKQRNKDNDVYYSMKNALKDYMSEYFSNEHRKTFEDIYCIISDVRSFDRNAKVTLSFNDREDFFYVDGEARKVAEKLGKNTLVKIKLQYSPFIQKKSEQFIYDFDVLELEEVKEVI